MAMLPEEAAAQVRDRIRTANEALAAEANDVPDLDMDLLRQSMETATRQPPPSKIPQPSAFGEAQDEPDDDMPDSGLELLSQMNELTGFKSTLPSFEDSLRKSPPKVREEPAAPNALIQKLQSMSSGVSDKPVAADDVPRRRKSKYDM